MRRCLSLVGLAVAAFLPGEARAAGVVGNGTPASCTQAALEAALVGGGAVTFDCGPGDVTIQLTSEQVISTSTTVDGGGRVTLQGADLTRMFRVPGAAPGIALTIQGLRLYRGECPFFEPGVELLSGGAIVAGAGSQITLVDTRLDSNSCRDVSGTLGRGGAVSVSNGSVLLRRVQAQNNAAGEGGVVYSLNSTVVIEDSRLTGNSPSNHGGVLAARSGSVAFRRNQVLFGHATSSGGCIDAAFGPKDAGMTVEATRILGADTFGEGGAIRQRGGALHIVGSSFGSGRAARGGAIFVEDVSDLSILNATFSANQAEFDAMNPGSGRGGAVYIAGATAGSVVHSTFALNSAENSGGAFAGDGPSPVLLRASVLGANASGTGSTFSPACAITLAAGPFNVQAPGEAADVDCVAGVLRADPRVELTSDPPTSVGVFRLLEGSPAIDLVTSGCPPPATDLRQRPRPFGAACDAGSYELMPLVDIGDSFVLEGDGAVTTATFVVELSGPRPTGTVTVAYATADDTAVAWLDYAPVSGVLTFPPGVTQQQVTVDVLGDGIDEPIERFLLHLVDPGNVAVGRSPGRGVIGDEDDPVVSIGDAAVMEGDVGTLAVQLTVSLASPPVESTAAYFTVEPGTALPGVDYAAAGGVVTFAPGVSTGTVTVNVLGDTLDEPDERFYVHLFGADSATVGDGEGVVRIQDDDGGVIRVGELGHGRTVRADAVGGSSLYVLAQPSLTSWEVVVDETSGDLGDAGPVVERLRGDLVLEQASVAVGTGSARALRWANTTTSGTPRESYVRFASPGCGSACGPDDVYRVRAYETTLRAARFNCAGGQVSAAVLENTGAEALQVLVLAWNSAGSRLQFEPQLTVTVAPRATSVLNVCALLDLDGMSGSLTAVHDGSYGQLVGKVVSVDPASGSSFDTPFTQRPR
jgi:hypothetical protein